ncbi:DMT family transporter [Dactylosporangium sp. NPDC000555]|uniref:DMT family transporter n=1 Tax=Dactylosporangium sp. NPDC000555 TaxID=3154260 RepID=UPI003319DBFB
MLVSKHPVATAQRSATGLWLLVLAGVLWGTGGLTGRLLAHETGLSPLAVAAYRLAVGGTLIIVSLVLIRRPLPRGRYAWTRITVIGLLAAVFQACYFAAVSLTTVSLATLLTIGASPVLVLTAECVTGRRRASVPMFATLALAVTGLVLLIGVPSGGLTTTRVLAGAALALLAAGGFATMTFVSARPVPGLDDLAATGLGFTTGAAVLTPLAAVASGVNFIPGPASIGLLLLLGTAPTAVAYALYLRGLRTTPAGTAALMALLEPFVGTVLAALILGDRLSPTGFIGAGLLAAAILLDTRSSHR